MHFRDSSGPIQTRFVAEDLHKQGKCGTVVKVQVFLKHMLP